MVTKADYNSRATTALRLDVQKIMPAVLYCIMALALYLAATQIIVPPAARTASTPDTEFSAERATRHLQVIAQEPHTIGSPAQARARDYIVEQIRGLGLTPVVQHSTAAVTNGSGLFASDPYNILVRLPGTASTGAVGVMAHYDSQPNTPGGSDNGAAAAGLLEAMRAIQAGPRLRNDLIFIFTDAEEVDAQGADAFYTQHPWAREIQLIVNFESAGDTGASVLMDIKPASMQLIDGYINAVPHPVAFSAMPALLTIMPIGTDMTVFTDGGVPGLNPMFGWHYRTTYHSFLESVETLDPGSLQHQGENALGLGRYFADRDLTTLQEDDNAVFFSLLPGLLVRYPASWARPLAVLAALGLAAVAGLGLRRRRLSLGGILAGFGMALLGTLIPILLAAAAWIMIANLHPEYWRNLMGSPYGADLYLLGFVALVFAISLGIFLLARRKLGVAALTTGAILLWLVPTLLTAWALPVMSYMFVLPVALMTCVLGALVIGPNREDRRSVAISAWHSWAWFAGLALTGALIVLVVVPFALLLHLVIGFWLITMKPALPLIAVPMLFLAAMLTLLAPQMDVLTGNLYGSDATSTRGESRRGRGWPAPALAGLLALGCLVAASITSGFTPAQPMPNGVWYQLDADRGLAHWYSYGTQPGDPWTAQFFPDAVEPVQLSEVYAATPDNPVPNGFRGPAPAASLAPPQLTVISDNTADGVRTLMLHIAGARPIRGLRVKVSGAPVLAAAVNGVRKAEAAWASRNEWYLRYYGMTPEGIDLALEVQPATGLALAVTDQSDGLPELPGVTYIARSPGMMPFAMAQEYMPYPETASVSKTFILP